MADINALAASIPDGSTLALAPDYSGCSLVVVRALIERGAKNLRLLGVPQLGFQADLLIGAGCVASVETAAVTLGELGPAPCFVRAIKEGRIEIKDSTCPAIHAGLQAAEKGIPFMPLRGILGSDLIHHRPDWKTISNPYGDDDPILLVPKIEPDTALFHAVRADPDNNVWIGVRRELMLMAHAAKQSLVTVEKVESASLLDDDGIAAGTIPGLYVSAVTVAEMGAKPLGLRGCYQTDHQELQDYVDLAKTKEGFQRYLDQVMAFA